MKPGDLTELTKSAAEKSSPALKGLAYGAYGGAGGAALYGIGAIKSMRKRAPHVLFSAKSDKLLKKRMLKGGLKGAGLLGGTAVIATLIANSLRGKK
jgi:hypothetical protein